MSRMAVGPDNNDVNDNVIDALEEIHKITVFFSSVRGYSHRSLIWVWRLGHCQRP